MFSGVATILKWPPLDVRITLSIYLYKHQKISIKIGSVLDNHYGIYKETIFNGNITLN